MEEVEEEVIEGYSRFKGASWFKLVNKKDVFVLGAGGIGR